MNLSGNDILVARVPSREGEVYDVRGFESDMSEAIMHAQVRIKLFSSMFFCFFIEHFFSNLSLTIKVSLEN